MVWAEMKARRLLEEGATRFKIHEGYIWFNENKDDMWEHTWIQLRNGTILDETLSQFEDMNIDEPHYIQHKAYTPKQYAKLCEKYPSSKKDIRDFKRRYEQGKVTE